jgi:hypothetical protein
MSGRVGRRVGRQADDAWTLYLTRCDGCWDYSSDAVTLLLLLLLLLVSPLPFVYFSLCGLWTAWPWLTHVCHCGATLGHCALVGHCW